MNCANKLFSTCSFVTLALLLLLQGCVTSPGLHHASYLGDIEAVKKSLSDGESINGLDPNGWTPLYGAVSEGHKEVVVHLIKNGANIDVKDKNGWTVIDEAEFQGREDITAILKDEEDRRKKHYDGSIRHYGSLVMSNITSPVYSEWFTKYPLGKRSYWDDPFRAINFYVRDTELKYLASADYHGSVYGFEDDQVQSVQGRFESDRSYQIRIEQIAFEQGERRKNLSQTRRLMIADALQWVMGGFVLENPVYNRSRAMMEFDLVSTKANFRQRIGAPMNNPKVAQSIYHNPDKVNLYVVFRIEEKSYQLYGVKIDHQGERLSAGPRETAVFNLSI